MAIQPRFINWLPIALMVGVLAGGTILIGNILVGQGFTWVGPLIWVPFISWALYFMAGGKLQRAHKYIFSMVGGILFGWVTIVVGNWLAGIVGGLWAYPIVVFCVATSIVLLELTDWFELAPAYFFGYAGYFATAFGFAGALGFSKPEDLTLMSYHIILTLAGIFLGWLTIALKGKMLNAMGVPFDQRQTIFDKES
jgi:hypothetical protein